MKKITLILIAIAGFSAQHSFGMLRGLKPMNRFGLIAAANRVHLKRTFSQKTTFTHISFDNELEKIIERSKRHAASQALRGNPSFSFADEYSHFVQINTIDRFENSLVKNSLDKNGKTLLQAAYDSGCPELIEFIKNWTQKV